MKTCIWKHAGWKEVEVWVADDMSPKQIKDYRIRDNRTSDYARWDFEALEKEITQFQLDPMDFSFDMPEPEREGVESDYRPFSERDDAEQMVDEDQVSRLTHNVFENFEMDFEPEYTGKYGIPKMAPTQMTGDKFMRFCDWRGVTDHEKYIAHFYYDDFKFIKAWRDPDYYIERLKWFKAVVAPDFSLYTDFPVALQILSCYRRQWVGAYWQSLGIDVIPDVVWGDEASYEFCFDGIPKHSTVAVSSVGVKLDEDWNGKSDSLFRKGYDEMIKRLEPTTIMFYGDILEGLEGNIIQIPSFYAERREMLNEKKRLRQMR